MSAECGALPRHPASSGSSRFEWGNWSCRGNSPAGPAFDREFKPPHRPLAQNAMWPPCSINIIRSGRLVFAVAARCRGSPTGPMDRRWLKDYPARPA